MILFFMIVLLRRWCGRLILIFLGLFLVRVMNGFWLCVCIILIRFVVSFLVVILRGRCLILVVVWIVVFIGLICWLSCFGLILIIWKLWICVSDFICCVLVFIGCCVIWWMMMVGCKGCCVSGLFWFWLRG